MGLRYALEPLAEVVLRNRFWMTWNLILAAVPVAVAVPVFRHRGPRGPLWWAGAALLVLFLPNAPYVVTDPQSTLGRVLTTLSWRWTPVVVLGTFLVIWAGHAVTRSLARSAAASATVGGRLWAAVEHWLRLRPL